MMQFWEVFQAIMNDKRPQFTVVNDIMNDIVNDKKDHNIVSNSFAHKLDDLLVLNAHWCSLVCCKTWQPKILRSKIKEIGKLAQTLFINISIRS